MATDPGTLILTPGDTYIDAEVVGASSDEPSLHVAPYRFHLGGSSWSVWQASPNYRWEGLQPGTEYTYMHQIRTAQPISIATGASVSTTTLSDETTTTTTSTTTTTTEPPATTTTTTSQEPPALVPFTDNFERADGPLGAPWEPSNLVISGGRATAPTQGEKALVDIGVSAGYRVSAQVNQRMWPTLVFRARDSDLYYALHWSNPDYELISYDGGVTTILQTSPTPSNLNATMWAEISEVSGGTQIVWGLNADTHGTYVDSRATRPLGHTKVGIQGQPDRYWDDFSVVALDGATTTTTTTTEPPATTTTTTVPPLPGDIEPGVTLGHLSHHARLHAIAGITPVSPGEGDLDHLHHHAQMKAWYDGVHDTPLVTVVDGDSHAAAHEALHAWINETTTTTSTTTTTTVPPAGETLWQANIDGAPLGKTSSGTMGGILGETFHTSTAIVANSEVVNEGGSKILRQHIPAGDLGSLIATPKLSRRAVEATISFDIRFDPGFIWRWGGKLGAGLVGVVPGTNILAPTSGQDRSTGCSIRLMWHGRGDSGTRPFQGALGPIPAGTDNQIVTYLYVRDPNTGFGGFGWHTPLGEFEHNVWHPIRMRARLNTPGVSDGIFQVWIDDELRWENHAMDYRGPDDRILWDAVLWDTHRGGGLTPVDWVSPRNDYLDLRNIRVTA